MSLVRHYFPGGNTPIGFVSFYKNILSSDSVGKIAVIKGGPGTGKSSIMKKIGEYFKNENEYVHFLHCSSDADSLDGIYLPKYNATVVDGTAPHIVEPRYPGVCDKIFDVGKYICENITENKKEILALNKNISDSFSDCYGNLRVASSIYEIMKNKSLKTANMTAVDSFCYNISKRVIHKKDSGKIRKMFLSGITPQGNVNFCDNIMNDKYIIRLESNVGDGGGELLKRLISYCQNQHTDMDIYFCPLKPYEPEHIVFKNTHIAITISNKFHSVQDGDEIIPFSDFVKCDYDNSENCKNYELYIEKALKSVKKAKYFHDELENYYIQNFDFSASDAVFGGIKDFLVS